ncbi:Oidioi.mRNA.OKI2018_I69.XSR.g13636.t1.cds [Oikopleura dioica]|uniref:Oidioi.mRNA.OKI2018_I69.XSR.g13636.t1.cds n=1 Tax=Oikopleura dioica TaxID=34765 RepID=A0ABN7SDK4_OIKDI|nr:Oidioi.mRNA.OKI2018_I69.XSR.g13636.t1.cds [Oikopleura dioica]
MPFWFGLIGAEHFEGDNIPQVLPYIVDWLSDNFRDAGDCASIERICRKLDEVALKSEEMYHDLVRKSFYCERARRNRFIKSIRRFMVMDKAYPWEEDKTFNTVPAFYRSKKGKHPLLRGAKNTEAFDALPEPIASALEASRDAALSAALPVPIFTEQVFQIWNCLHERSTEEETVDEELEVDQLKGNKLPVISMLLKKYLRRELAILDIDEARYYRYKPNTKSWNIIIEQEWAFRYLSKNEVPTLPTLYKSSREEKVRAFLACFDAEIVMFIDPNFSNMPCFMITFIACLRYLWVQTNMEEWEVDAFVAQFALLDLFTSPDKHFRRLKWLFGGGEETCPVELPACERSITLANLFAAVYYAVMRCQVVTGLPFQDGNGKPCLKDIFSGSVFACTYQILKSSPAKRNSGRYACGIYDDKWLGMNPESNNKMEAECYEKAATVYDRMRANFITPLRKFDARLAEMKSAEQARQEELKQKAEKEKLRALRKARKAQEANPLDRDFSNLLQKHESIDNCDGWLNRALGDHSSDSAAPELRSPNIDDLPIARMQLEGTSSGDEQTLRPDAVSPEQTITPDDFETPSIPEGESPSFEMPDENEAKPIIDKVDDTPVRRPASVIAPPPQKEPSGVKIDDIFERIQKASETPEPKPASEAKSPAPSTSQKDNSSTPQTDAAKTPKEIPKNMQELKQLKKSLTKAISKNMLAQDSNKS